MSKRKLGDDVEVRWIAVVEQVKEMTKRQTRLRAENRVLRDYVQRLGHNPDTVIAKELGVAK
jgi:hypothetical protein